MELPLYLELGRRSLRFDTLLTEYLVVPKDNVEMPLLSANISFGVIRIDREGIKTVKGEVIGNFLSPKVFMSFISVFQGFTSEVEDISEVKCILYAMLETRTVKTVRASIPRTKKELYTSLAEVESSVRVNMDAKDIKRPPLGHLVYSESLKREVEIELGKSVAELPPQLSGYDLKAIKTIYSRMNLKLPGVDTPYMRYLAHQPVEMVPVSEMVHFLVKNSRNLGLTLNEGYPVKDSGEAQLSSYLLIANYLKDHYHYSLLQTVLHPHAWARIKKGYTEITSNTSKVERYKVRLVTVHLLIFVGLSVFFSDYKPLIQNKELEKVDYARTVAGKLVYSNHEKLEFNSKLVKFPKILIKEIKEFKEAK